MKDKQLEQLQQIKVPKASSDKKMNALASAMSAYEETFEQEIRDEHHKKIKSEKNSNNLQGNVETSRQRISEQQQGKSFILSIADSINLFWSSIMKKKTIIAASFVTVTTFGLFSVLQLTHNTTGSRVQSNTASMDFSQGSGASVSSVANKAEQKSFLDSMFSKDSSSVSAEFDSSVSESNSPLYSNRPKLRREVQTYQAAPQRNQKLKSLDLVAPSEFQGKLSNPPGRAIIADQSTPHDARQENLRGRDQFEEYQNNALKQVSDEPVSTFSLDVDTASYAMMRRTVQSGWLPPKDSVRVEEYINYFDYDYSAPVDQSVPFKPTVMVYPSPWNDNAKLIHIGIKGYEFDQTDKPKANLVFLIDVSGSMSSPDKLPLLISGFKLMVENLNPTDTVAIVTYAGRAGTVLAPTPVSEKHKIIQALSQLQSGGSTAGAAGIEGAYALAQQNFDEEGVNRVILATDGDFNVGAHSTRELESLIAKKRKSGIGLSVLGFGSGNYNDHMMQTLAQKGDGNAAYIDSIMEAQKVLVQEAGSTLFTIAKDVKVQVEFNPNQVSEYRLIGYETRHLNREDFNNDKVDAGEVGAGHTVTAIYEIVTKDAKQKMVDPLRYADKTEQSKGVEEAKEVDSDKTDTGELAFLKMRYKLPKESKSKLITQPIYAHQAYESIGDVSEDTRFATAVAGFAQLLRGSVHLGDFSYDDVIAIAKSGKGTDPHGYRAEFIKLVQIAKSAKSH